MSIVPTDRRSDMRSLFVRLVSFVRAVVSTSVGVLTPRAVPVRAKPRPTRTDRS